MRVNRQKVVISIVMALVVGSIGAWQYSKFVNKHGLFHALSREYGEYVLLSALVLMLAYALCMVWTDDSLR
jgi:hypothetical protein